jgi:hypothetical protein
VLRGLSRPDAEAGARTVRGLPEDIVRASPEPFRIFVGYDANESIAYHVLAHSILRRATMPVAIVPVVRTAIPGYRRPRGEKDSTDFSISRFMVPWLSGYDGWSVFMDCDMLCRVDVSELLFEMIRQRDKAVLVCQHDYVPRAQRKFLGNEQTAYPRKNWSSLMAFNGARCQALSPDYVEKASGLELHRFAWLPDEAIGALPLEWNWLVGEYDRNDDAKIVHFTEGGPWFQDYIGVDYAAEWRAEYRSVVSDAARLAIAAGLMVDDGEPSEYPLEYAAGS